MPVSIKEFQDELNRTNQVFREFFKEDDRAAVVLVGAEIDRVVLSIIEAHLLPGSKISSPLLDRNGPLEAFAARIELSYRLGLLPPVVHHDLQVVRKIRNEFAHGPRGLNFEQSPVKELASKLITGHQEIQKMIARRKTPPPENSQHSHPRNIFRLSASLILAHLAILRFQIPKIDPQWPKFFKAPPKSQAPRSAPNH